MKINERALPVFLGVLASVAAFGCFSSDSAKPSSDGGGSGESSSGGGSNDGGPSSGGQSVTGASSSSGGPGGGSSSSDGGSGGAAAEGGSGSSSGGSSSDGGGPRDAATGCSANITITNVAFYGTSVAADAGSSLCPSIMPASATITAAPYSMSGTGPIVFGSGDSSWTTYTAESTGQAAPTLSLNQSDGALTIAANIAYSADGGFAFSAGGLYFGSPTVGVPDCMNASGYDGVRFTLAGDLGGCSMAFVVSDTETLAPAADARGTCSATTCVAPYEPVTPAGTVVTVPFAALTGGSPTSGVDTTAIVSMQWQIDAPSAGD